MSKQNINEHSKIEKKMGELTKQYGSNYELTHFFPYSSSTIVNNKASRIISPLESSSTPAVDLNPLDSNLHTFQSCSIGAAMKLADIKRLEEQKKVTKTKGLNCTIVVGSEGSYLPYISEKIDYKSDVNPFFDWEAYIKKYPDLQKAGYNSRQQAIDHYLNYGSKEGRVYTEDKDVNVIVTSFDNIANASNNIIANSYNNLYGFTIEWYGVIIPSVSGNWTFNFATNGIEYLWIGNHAIADFNITNADIANSKKSFSAPLTKDVKYPIRIHFACYGSVTPTFRMDITPPNSKVTNHYSDFYILRNEDGSIFEPTQVYFSLSENSADNTKKGLFTCGVTTSADSKKGLLGHKNEPTVNGYVKDVVYKDVWAAIDPSREPGEIKQTNELILGAWNEPKVKFGSKLLYESTNKYIQRGCSGQKYIQLNSFEHTTDQANTNRVWYQLVVKEYYEECDVVDGKPKSTGKWKKEVTKVLAEGTVYDSVRCLNWLNEQKSLGWGNHVGSWHTYKNIDSKNQLISGNCRFKLTKTPEGNLVIRYAVAASKNTAKDSATGTNFYYSKDLSRFLYNVDVPPFYNNAAYTDKNTNTIQSVSANSKIVTGNDYTAIGDFAPINTDGAVNTKAGSCLSQCSATTTSTTTGCQYYYEWKDDKGVTKCTIPKDTTSNLVNPSLINVIQPNSAIKSSKLFVKNQKLNLEEKYMNPQINSTIVQPSNYSSYASLTPNYTVFSEPKEVGLLTFPEYKSLKEQKQKLEGFSGIEGMEPNYEDFDWVAYLLRYQDLTRAGITTREAALQHYIRYGKNERREYPKLPVNADGTYQIVDPNYFNNIDSKTPGLITALELKSSALDVLNTGYNTTLDSINTNADKIQTSITEHSQLQQKLGEKEIYKYTVDSTKDGKLMMKTPTMSQAMTEDVNQMLMHQNTTYIMGSLAAATVLITAIFIGSNSSSS